MEPGTVIAERYRLGQVLAETDVGVLFEARHIGLDDPVIVKVLSDRMHDARIGAKFVREARQAARIKSDHVARFVDVGTMDDGRAFVVMEYLAGEDLGQLVQRGPIHPRAAIDWVLETCEALAAAHSLGIIHRDLRASNLFLAQTPSGVSSVKVMGFGTSRTVDSVTGEEEDAGLTVAGVGASLVDYMAPELFIRTLKADARADVWSLGVILFELLTGQRPFRGNYEEKMKAILVDNTTPPTSLRDDLPDGVEEIVLRCLEKRAEDRFRCVRTLAAALAPHASGHGKALAHRIVSGAPANVIATLPSLPASDPPDESEHSDGASLHRRLPSGALQEASIEVLRSQPPGASAPPTLILRSDPEAPPPRVRARWAAVAFGMGAAALLAGGLLIGRIAYRTNVEAAAPSGSASLLAAPPIATEPTPTAKQVEGASGSAAEPPVPAMQPDSTPSASKRDAPKAGLARSPSKPSAPATQTPKASSDPWGWNR